MDADSPGNRLRRIFSNRYQKCRDWLLPFVTQVETAPSAQTVEVGAIGQLKAVTDVFDSTQVDTNILQTATQAHAKTVHLYQVESVDGSRQRLPSSLFEVSASRGGVAVRARNNNKRAAKNRAAFMLLKALLGQNRLSEASPAAETVAGN